MSCMDKRFDDGHLCSKGEELWNTHTSVEKGYAKYLGHIWACKECQCGLGLTPELIRIQKQDYKKKVE